MSYDFLIKNGLIVDGTGEKAYKGDVAIKDDKIVKVGDLGDCEAQEVIDAEGKMVCPGFIDNHSHSDLNILFDTLGSNCLRQGITTVIGGQCGEAFAPHKGTVNALIKASLDFIPEEEVAEIQNTTKSFGEFINVVKKTPLGVNIAFQAGHSTIRAEVMGYSAEEPTEEQLEQMKQQVRDAMEAGAIGMSAGLIYPPGSYGKKAEIIELCKVVKEYGGKYTTHMRSESDQIIEALTEAIDIARAADIPLVVSHHKVSSKVNWGKSEQTLAMINEAIESGMDIHMDQYPYVAGATKLIASIPIEFASVGVEALLEKLKEKAFRQEILDFVDAGQSDSEMLIRSTGGFENIMVCIAPNVDGVAGKRITEIAEMWNVEPIDALAEVLIKSNGAAMAVYYVMDEGDLRRIMKHPHTMFGTDAAQATYCNLFGHPRAFGTFPHIIDEYVNKQNLLTLEEMVYKSSGLPAKVNKLPQRGQIKEGYYADVIVLDEQNLKVDSEFSNPDGGNHGFEYVFVNGQIVVKDDAVTDTYAGRPILWK